MKISEIRRVIETAAWVRNDLTGGTAGEFKSQQVGPRLREQIAKLEALDIPARFAADLENRAHNIRACHTVIARWEAVQ